MRTCYFIFLSLLLFSCSWEDQNVIFEDAVTPDTLEVSTLSLEDEIKRQIELSLDIPRNEEYDIQFHYDYINRDTLMDIIILVNREAYAFQKSQRENKLSFLEYMGFTGPYNYVFVKLGGSKKVIQAPPVGSSVFHPLIIHFEPITIPGQNDFYVQYRSRNSMFRNYYTIRGEEIYLTFNCPEFDLIGEENPKAYYIEHSESTVRTAKDIALYHGIIPNYTSTEIEDVNNFTPSNIQSTGELFVYFIFDEKTKKYKTPFTPEKQNDEVVVE